MLLPQHRVYINLGDFHSLRNTKELRNGENRENTWFLNLGLGNSVLFPGGKKSTFVREQDISALARLSIDP